MYGCCSHKSVFVEVEVTFRPQQPGFTQAVFQANLTIARIYEIIKNTIVNNRSRNTLLSVGFLILIFMKKKNEGLRDFPAPPAFTFL